MSNNDYLWDRSGDPDPEIERLENLLAPLAYRPGRQFRQRRYWPVAAGIAATVVLTAGAVWMATRPQGPSWNVVALEGAPQRHSTKQQNMSRGGTVETGAASRLRLELAGFGQVDVEPNTRLKLLVTKHDEQRMDLAQGKIHALIWAPPHQFYVNTPSAVTVDLGCSYTLKVDNTGNGTVRVDYGWVAFDDHGKESFIPAQAVCITRPGKGPGIPYYEDAPLALREAVDRFDTTADLSTMPAILGEARPRDAMTVWHLLRRVPAEDRGPVYDRLVHLMQVPENVTRDQVVAGDRKAIDALWDALGLGDIQFWRQWKR
jgi:hypothetical protein